ncbi:MAG: 2-succinyl-5-enolpyruvyl-6-hydroxy-3-cyclohexene-1-carboxylic-acid synthase [Bacteroidetes bacterium]|nr:MAG: 2-succinyl-5-enolpyruvyl-6-hydroxy-3-cyclohexene-1-carboxylic-acid synthase [Bacteroidota bacterium]
MPSIRRGISELPYLCHAHGVEYVIISPGSRNAPLTIAFATFSDIKSISITDERSAGYYALGLAQQLKKPVVLVCTSGTAMVNYAPALAEAYYLKVPLIAITADRPAEWIDQNDGQTIRQNGLFANFIKDSLEVPVETEKDEDLWLFRRKVSEVINYATSGAPGPVHINVPLREPLYDPLPEVTEPPPVIKALYGTPVLSQQQTSSLKKLWQSFEKKLILCGMSYEDPGLSEILESVITHKQAVVINENLSNLKIEGSIDTPDIFIASLSEEQKDDFRPHLLISIGGPVVSKRLKKYLRAHKPAEHWHISPNISFTDTFQSLNRSIGIEPVDFFSTMATDKTGDTQYPELAKQVAQHLTDIHTRFVEKIPFTDLAAYKTIFDHLPENCNLHLANSTPVRYSQLFPTQKKINYFSNRGTSGIDGCVSTVAGAAMASEKLNIALVGDLAFIYDSNALWNNRLTSNLRVIIMDNEGGNIFKLINTSPVINPIRHFFETPHQVKVDKLCEAFGVEYFKADNNKDLKEILIDFFKPNQRPSVLHIQTTGELSAKTFKQYYQFISQNK